MHNIPQHVERENCSPPCGREGSKECLKLLVHEYSADPEEKDPVSYQLNGPSFNFTSVCDGQSL